MKQLIATFEKGKKMTCFRLIAAVALGACSLASAQDVLLTGHVQRVSLQPPGAENCPPVCPAISTAHPDGSSTVCVSNAGGCQSMEVKVDRVYLGKVDGETRQFNSRTGEWGPSFPATGEQIVVSEEAGKVSWSPASERDGKVFIDPKRLRSIGGIPTSPKGDSQPVALDVVLARVSTGH
ncbi:hypothetical protein [Massilia horti]|uniref:Secreted protein n=1 Tax=Massilia horti TaxID=2562153 RepID=A0A4Y9SQ25_9BURK|nr:hypothetical protein [Massilia horti]TFW28575.1 hypothetical protein E4O92_20855 [Massilia horti]